MIISDFQIGKLTEEIVDEKNIVDRYKKKIITIPNILSFFRICLIPLIVWIYLGKQDYIAAGFALLVSGLTDIVDGYIARTYNMISDVGKVLDPIADKATQAVMLLCLLSSFPLMWIPIGALIVKESFMAISGYIVIRKTGIVLGANWHGKAATVLLTACMALHLFWHSINTVVSLIAILAATAMILLSLALYAVRNIKYITGKYNEK